MLNKINLITIILLLSFITLISAQKLSVHSQQKSQTEQSTTDSRQRLPQKAILLKNNLLPIDGAGNNLIYPTFNQAGTGFKRLTFAAYKDGVSQMVIDRPNPRNISNLVGAIQTDVIPTDPKVSILFTMWGQFIDHDITLAVAQKATNITVTTPNGTVTTTILPETAPIIIPKGDPQFDPTSTGTATIAFTRKQFVPNSNPRIAINTLSGFIDGSMIYGSTNEIANPIRTFSRGQMNISTNNLLPIDTTTGLFIAGDSRANQNIVLTTLHTIWVRQHNRLCNQILAINPSLTDQRVFNIARNIIAGLISHITYDEWLPPLLGPQLYSKYIGQYRGYDSDIDARIPIEFDSAAFRFGHSLLVSQYPLIDSFGGLFATLNLTQMFRNPSSIINNPPIIDYLMNGLSKTPAKKRSCTIINEVRNLLVEAVGIKSDLFSQNVQRGRDNGLPDYSSMRVAFGLTPGKGFSDVTSNSAFVSRLSAAYPSYSKLDPWVGIVCQDSLNQAVFGRLGGEIIGRTFGDLRNGNRLWYENYMHPQVISYIKNTSFSDIISRNTNANVSGNVFLF